MNKRIISFFAAAALSVSMAPVSLADDGIKVVVDGVSLPAGDMAPFIEDGRTLVPMRAIFEALGATVEWDGETQTVTSSDKAGATRLELRIGEKSVKINGSDVAVDVPAKIVEGRTVVPVRVVSEGMNCEVTWLADTKTVDIKSGAPLEFWAKDSEVLASVIEYVKEVTDPGSDKFIPEEDRIVVSDMDGTLMNELCPSYFDYCLFLHRALHDDTYVPSADMAAFAKELEEGIKIGKMPEGVDKKHAGYLVESFKGMSIEDYKEYIRDFKNTEAEGFTNLKRGYAFYKPMVSLVKYLQNNGFTVYVVSGADRTCVRVLMEGNLDIPENNVIGSDTTFVAKGQDGKDGLDYLYSSEDDVIIGGDLVVKNLKMNKVSAIAREIGKHPVIALGNSSGDLSMCQYTVNNEKYEGRAYLLLCDDTEREFGKPDKAESFKKTCEDLGFYTVSMKNDFATIYGDDVEIVK